MVKPDQEWDLLDLAERSPWITLMLIAAAVAIRIGVLVITGK